MINLNGKKVLITGATGFVGNWLARDILDKGAIVFSMSRKIPKKENLNKLCPLYDIYEKINFLEADLKNYNDVEKVVSKISPEFCFHLAAYLNPADDSPREMFEINVKGTWNILEACKKSKVKYFISGSTFKVYGKQDTPFTEDLPSKGISAYDVSKACADLIVNSYSKRYDISTAVVRCSNIYGEGDFDSNGIIQETLLKVLNGETPIINNRLAIRDFIYVRDICKAYILVAENFDKENIKGEIFNFSTGVPISIADLYKKIIYAAGKDIEPIINEKLSKEDKRYISSEKAKEVLGWNPEYSLEQGLKKTAEWYQKCLNK